MLATLVVLIAQRIIGVLVLPTLVLAGHHQLLLLFEIEHVGHFIEDFGLAGNYLGVDRARPVIPYVGVSEPQPKFGQNWAGFQVHVLMS